MEFRIFEIGVHVPGKIFINYRRDDDPSAAARVRDALAAKYGKFNVFMDIDNLLVGQRFDLELEKALSGCDILISIIGGRWLDLLDERSAANERDFVREEIAKALTRNIAVIPIRVGREGKLPRLPRPEEIPNDIRDLFHYQKHDVTHERFGRDVNELVEAIATLRRSRVIAIPRATKRPVWLWIGVGLVTTVATFVFVYFTSPAFRLHMAPPNQQTTSTTPGSTKASSRTSVTASYRPGPRRAFVAGVSAYDAGKGVPALKVPAYDAEIVAHVLRAQALYFDVHLVTRDGLANKSQFQNILASFLENVQPREEVVFFFLRSRCFT